MIREFFWPSVVDQDFLKAARQRCIVIICILAATTGILSGVTDYLETPQPQPYYSAYRILGSALFLVGPFLVYFRFPERPISIALLIYAYIRIVGVSALKGALVSNAIMFLVPWIMVITLVLGWREGLVAALAAIAAATALFLFSDYLPPPTIPMNYPDISRWLFIILIINFAVVGLCAGIFQREMSRMTESLASARRAAEEADRAKTEFLANMSHEIRTPMNGVMGMAELMSKTQLNDKQQMYCQVIVKSGTSLLTIINDILDFSKIDANKLNLDPEPFELSQAVGDVTTLLAARAAEKNLELSVRVDPTLPPMMVGDAGRLRQITLNLLGNAVKFTEQGQVHLDVSRRPDANPDNGHAALLIKVIDTGIGIAADKLDSVFDKFSQADGSATRKHEGTGLGLAISASLVKLMGGKIGVSSEIGKGTVFWFEIDLPEIQGTPVANYPPFHADGQRILIVDDNKINRAVLVEQLDAQGFECASVESGQAAQFVIQSAEENNVHIDLIILDFQMPNMDGEQTLRALRKTRTGASIPVIMLTSVDHAGKGKLFSSLGIEAHLTKPIRSDLLTKTIASVLIKASQPDTAVA